MNPKSALTAIALTFAASMVLPSCVSVEDKPVPPVTDVSVHRKSTTVSDPVLGTSSSTTTTTTRGY